MNDDASYNGYDSDLVTVPEAKQRRIARSAGFRVAAQFDETSRSVAWNRLWYKMLSEVLEEQWRNRPPDG